MSQEATRNEVRPGTFGHQMVLVSSCLLASNHVKFFWLNLVDSAREPRSARLIKSVNRRVSEDVLLIKAGSVSVVSSGR